MMADLERISAAGGQGLVPGVMPAPVVPVPPVAEDAGPADPADEPDPGDPPDER